MVLGNSATALKKPRFGAGKIAMGFVSMMALVLMSTTGIVSAHSNGNGSANGNAHSAGHGHVNGGGHKGNGNGGGYGGNTNINVNVDVSGMSGSNNTVQVILHFVFG